MALDSSVFSSRHVTFNETGKITPEEFSPWNIHSEGQWEGILPNRSHQPEQNIPEEEEPDLPLPNHQGAVEALLHPDPVPVPPEIPEPDPPDPEPNLACLASPI